MEFEEGLFRGVQTLGSLIPKNNIWCRITELIAVAHPTKASKRLVSYRIGYWDEIPTIDSPTCNALVLNVEGVRTEVFYVLVDSSIVDLVSLERACFDDFITSKVMGLGYLTEMELYRLIDFYGKYPAPRAILDYSDRTTTITAARHTTTYRSIDLVSELTLESEIATLSIQAQSHDYATPFTLYNQWLDTAIALHISPHSLKAVNIL